MSLTEEADALTRRPGSTCTVQLLLNALDEADRAELAEALTSTAPHSGLHSALKARGWTPLPSEGGLNRHRNGKCACDSHR